MKVGLRKLAAGSRVLCNMYVQQSPWLAVANKQLEIMGRYLTELGMTPAARTRVAARVEEASQEPVTIVRLIGMRRDDNGDLVEFDRPRTCS